MAASQPLNLLSLARTDPGEAKAVPGTQLEVRAVAGKLRLSLEESLWLAVLSGELIIDLPHGDFRRLQAGDSLLLEAGLEASFLPLDEAVVLTAPGATNLPGF